MAGSLRLVSWPRLLWHTDPPVTQLLVRSTLLSTRFARWCTARSHVLGGTDDSRDSKVHRIEIHDKRWPLTPLDLKRCIEYERRRLRLTIRPIRPANLSTCSQPPSPPRSVR
ncbi:hypothetical protein L227DRAFT_253924 [Lentinus tigrinus ALCF2SS1-6]|uniref:Uncharacterized protein n=1 Tax=Lentinus tigrinus ALCF2SS1-6 TaxID=1328759 RepID=A0A5C2RZR9_9APHY|nr:hypothetical protein L227DRAFT_253924 [Lentinus tigrinus ALCF2SS1-6]